MRSSCFYVIYVPDNTYTPRSLRLCTLSLIYLLCVSAPLTTYTATFYTCVHGRRRCKQTQDMLRVRRSRNTCLLRCRRCTRRIERKQNYVMLDAHLREESSIAVPYTSPVCGRRSRRGQRCFLAYIQCIYCRTRHALRAADASTHFVVVVVVQSRCI